MRRSLAQQQPPLPQLGWAPGARLLLPNPTPHLPLCQQFQQPVSAGPTPVLRAPQAGPLVQGWAPRQA